MRTAALRGAPVPPPPPTRRMESTAIAATASFLATMRYLETSSSILFFVIIIKDALIRTLYPVTDYDYGKHYLVINNISYNTDQPALIRKFY